MGRTIRYEGVEMVWEGTAFDTDFGPAVEEPWFPADRCTHPVTEVYVGRTHTRTKKMMRCMACLEAWSYPICWLNFFERKMKP